MIQKLITILTVAIALPLAALSKPARVPTTGDRVLADLGTYYAVAYPYNSGRATPMPRLIKNAKGVLTVVLYGKYNVSYETESVTLVSKTNPKTERFDVSCSPGTIPSKFSPWARKESEDDFDLYILSALKQSAKESYMQFEKLNVICRAPQDGDPSQKNLIQDLVGDPEVVALEIHSEYLEAVARALGQQVQHAPSATVSNRGQAAEWSNYVCTGGLPVRTQVVYATSSEKARKNFCGYDDQCLRSYTTCRQR